MHTSWRDVHVIFTYSVGFSKDMYTLCYENRNIPDNVQYSFLLSKLLYSNLVPKNHLEHFAFGFIVKFCIGFNMVSSWNKKLPVPQHV